MIKTRDVYKIQSAPLSTAVAAVLVLLAHAGCAPNRDVLQARQQLDKGRIDQARRHVDRGLQARPDDPDLLRLSIQIHLRLDDRAGAVGVYRTRRKRAGQDQKLLRHLAISMLRWGLRHRDPLVRLAALQGARRTDAAPLEQDVARRLRDPDEVVRSWAAVALSGTPAGASVMERQLMSTNDDARAISVNNLARIARAAAIKPLSRFVDDPSPRVRAALAHGLVQTMSARALPFLIRLAGDADRSVRAAAVTALGQLGEAGGARTVRKALEDAYTGVRRAAVGALADLKVPDARPALARIAAGDDLPAALHAGARLWRLGEIQPVLTAIAKALVDRRTSVRAAACNTAGSIRDRVALMLAKRALRDPAPTVRMAAARAVMAHEGARAAIRTAAAMKNLSCVKGARAMDDLCLQAAEILARAGDKDGLDTLETLVRTGSTPGIRIAALSAAGINRGVTALTVDALMDRSALVPVAAAIQIYDQVR